MVVLPLGPLNPNQPLGIPMNYQGISNLRFPGADPLPYDHYTSPTQNIILSFLNGFQSLWVEIFVPYLDGFQSIWVEIFVGLTPWGYLETCVVSCFILWSKHLGGSLHLVVCPVVGLVAWLPRILLIFKFPLACRFWYSPTSYFHWFLYFYGLFRLWGEESEVELVGN